MDFLNCLNLKDNDVVAFNGAGGKTSLIFKLAFEAKSADKKVLVLTTTKMYMPSKNQYDFIDMKGEIFSDIEIGEKGIYLNAPFDDKINKIVSTDILLLKDRVYDFDLILIETDGAKEKPLKGWNEYEPVIPDFTTKTVGIVDIQAIGKTIDENNVHRLDIFCNLVGAKKGDKVIVEHLKKVIKDKNGLFKNSKGEKILFINKVESIIDKKNVDELVKDLNMRFTAGSVKNGEIYACN